jgi:hypothetical protein
MIWNKGRRRLIGLKSPRNVLLLWKLRNKDVANVSVYLRKLFESSLEVVEIALFSFFWSVLFLHPHEPSPKCTWKHTEGDNFRHSFWNFCDTQAGSINVVTPPQKKTPKQCTYNVILRRVRATVLAVGKQLLIHILSVCLLHYVSSMQCVMRHVILFMVCQDLTYFSTLSLKWHDFRKKRWI